MSRIGGRYDKRPEFTIVDMRSGRGLGGHCFDYLIALQAAFRGRPIEVIAPFVGEDAVANTRLNVYRHGFRAYRRAISNHGIGVVHNSSLNDYLCLAAASMTIPPSRRGFCMMMLYRDPSIESFGAGGPAINRAAIWLIRRMIRKGLLHPASDSPLVLEHWLEATGAPQGAVVPTPPLPTADEGPSTDFALPDHEGPLVVIPGRMRSEKGAANYPVVARAVLEEFPDGLIAIQTAEGDDQSKTALKVLRSEFADDPRVLLIDQHLTASEYGELLAAADVAVLPYDTAGYGAGSSGVVGDVLDSGGVVVAAPIEWIRLQYSDDDRVVLIDDPTSVGSVRDGLTRATAVHAGHVDSDRVTSFNAQWNEAVDAALATRSDRTS